MIKIKKQFSMDNLTEVSFKTSNPEQLTKIIKAIGEIGNPGHTFTIVLDPDNSDYKTEFTWDGDGSDYIDLDKIKEFSTTCSKLRRFSDDKMLFVEYEDEDGDTTHQVMKKSEFDKVKSEAEINRASGAKLKILTEETYDETNPKHKKYKDHPVTETKEFSGKHGSKSAEEVLGKELAWDLMELAWDSGRYSYDDIDRLCDKVEKDSTINLKGLRKLVKSAKDSEGDEFNKLITRIVGFIKSPSKESKKFSSDRMTKEFSKRFRVTYNLGPDGTDVRSRIIDALSRAEADKRFKDEVLNKLGKPWTRYDIKEIGESKDSIDTTYEEVPFSDHDREQVPQYIADEVDKNGVIVKYKDSWRIVSKKQKPYEFWDATYDTKEDAEAALAAYHANKD